MDKICKILFLLLLSLVNSCEEINIYNCSDCLEVEPSICDLNIIITNKYNYVTGYRVITYQGKIEDNIIIDDRETTVDSFNLTVQLNKEYSVKVITRVNNADYIAINSAFPRVEYDEAYCEMPCYFIKGNKIKVFFKYN